MKMISMGNLSLISTGPFSAGDSININTSVLMNNSDPFYPTSFNLYDTPTYNMPNNIFADNEITAMPQCWQLDQFG